MDTPYGEIPDRFVPDMTPQDMHDFLRRRYARRDVLRGAAVTTAAVAGGPLFWRQSAALAGTTPIGPRWIAFGGDPAQQMQLSWSAGTAAGAPHRPGKPQVRWGRDRSYGSVRAADRSAQVPVPVTVRGEPAENTYYNSILLRGLAPGTRYHYSVSNDGVSWSADATFRTAVTGRPAFRFTAFGDEATSAATAIPMVRLVSSLKPAFHLISGDLAYATPGPRKIPRVTGFNPARWDRYLALIGRNGAASIPWQASVGAHEIEPLNNHGYAGFVTRFAQPYDHAAGSPVVYDFTYGNVAFLHLDGNDLSAQEPANNGYTGGAQTTWLAAKLAAYRAARSGIDFIVVICNCCCYSSNQNHGSDGGLRDVWGPIFDRHQVDLVISGHVHAYERSNPMRAGQPTAWVASGGTVRPATDGTTYIDAGGGGNGLYKSWYGHTGGGDAGSKTAPKIWRWSGGDTAQGGSGTRRDRADRAKEFSAYRRAVFSCLVVDVTPPAVTGGRTSLHLRALRPAQTSRAVTSISHPEVMDSVTLVRTSRAISGP
jgi:Purple acid Phosphatase, N-terminal domain/Calcineurin-like phosphoesterase